MPSRPAVSRVSLCSLALVTFVAGSGCAKHDAPLNDTSAALAPAPAEKPPAAATPASDASLTPVRGTVAAVNDTVLTVTTPAGERQIYVIPPLHVYERTTSDLAHVTPNSVSNPKIRRSMDPL